LAKLLALLGLETVRSNLLGWILCALGTAHPARILRDHQTHPERYRGQAAQGGGDTHAAWPASIDLPVLTH